MAFDDIHYFCNSKTKRLPKIGNIELPEFPLLLAPMEDVSDPPFRALCKEQGADVVYTEFVSSEGLIRNAAKSMMKRSEEHTSELQSRPHLVCRLLLEK